MSGKVFGAYRLVRLLSQGRRAEVYLAINETDPQLPRRLALKKLLVDGSSGPQLRAGVSASVTLGQLLDHPALVRILGQGQVGPACYVITEFVDGPDLDKLLFASLHKSLPVPTEVIYHLAKQLADALAYAQSGIDAGGGPLGLVHGDLCPPNVLLSTLGAVKLSGLEFAGQPSRSPIPSLEAFGRGAYMSPEQVRGEPLTLTSDIFSFGVLLYQIMTGAGPFNRDEDHQSREAVLAGRVPSPAHLRPNLPNGLVALVQRCLSPAPEDRYPHAQALQEAITEEARHAEKPADSASLARFLEQLFPAQLAQRPRLTTVEMQAQSAAQSAAQDDSAQDPAAQDDTAPANTTYDPSQTLSEELPTALHTLELGDWATASGQEAAGSSSTNSKQATCSETAAQEAEDLRASTSAEHMAITTADFQTSLADPRRIRLVGRPDAVPPAPSSISSTRAQGLGQSTRPLDPQADPFQLGSLRESDEEQIAAVSSLAAADPSGHPDTDNSFAPGTEAGNPLASEDPPRSRRWILPFIAASLVLALVALIGGPSSELATELLPPTETPPKVAGSDASTGPLGEDAPAQLGTLIINSQPWAYVSVDGVLREWVTPTHLELAAGPHVIGLSHPSSDWRVERTVTVVAGKELTLSVNR